MRELIESTYVLRQSLGHYLEIIKRMDPWLRERRATILFRGMFIKRYGKRCAYCHKAGPVQAAHIVPLEIGGTTEEKNLILLCKDCHRFYDQGHLSIQAMKEIASEWQEGKTVASRPPLGSLASPYPAMIPPPKSIQGVLTTAMDLQSRTHYCKAISILDKALTELQLDLACQSYLAIKQAELTRRRSARGVLAKALARLQDLDLERLPAIYRPLYYYELGYLHRLTGYHAKAARIMRQSEEASMATRKSDIPPVGYVAASVNEILCLLAAKETINQKTTSDFVNRLEKLQIISFKHGGYWGGRWAKNCAAHKVQVYLKKRDEEESWPALHRLREIYYCSDISNGWDAGARPTISLLEGLTRTLIPRDDSELQLGIGLLARALVTRLGPRKRPEGIRDVGFGLVEGIQKADIKSASPMVDFIQKLMNRTMDGTSVLWPWRVHHR